MILDQDRLDEAKLAPSQSNNTTQTIPVEWNEPEFQKKFVQLFNILEMRVTKLEKLTQPLVKQERIQELQAELKRLEEEVA